MKLFSGSLSVGWQFSSAFVIYSVGGRAGDTANCGNILSQAKTEPGERASDLGWIRLPHLTANGIETPMQLYFPSLAKKNTKEKEKKKKKDRQKERKKEKNGNNTETLSTWQINNRQPRGIKAVSQETPNKGSRTRENNKSHVSCCSYFYCHDKTMRITSLLFLWNNASLTMPSSASRCHFIAITKLTQ